MKPNEQIELVLLHMMVEETPSEYLYGWYFHFKCFERASGMDREIVRGFLRSMRNRGLVQHGVGFTDDGQVAGGGYTLIPAGMMHYQNLKVQLRNAPLAAVAEVQSWGGVDYF